MALTVVPYRPSSSVPTRASIATAALAVLYAASARKPYRPAEELVRTTAASMARPGLASARQ